jgi:hypothetical protein
MGGSFPGIRQPGREFDHSLSFIFVTLRFIFVTICVLFYYVCITALHTLVAGLLARSQYPEGPATGHLDTGFSWFPCV